MNRDRKHINAQPEIGIVDDKNQFVPAEQHQINIQSGKLLLPGNLPPGAYTAMLFFRFPQRTYTLSFPFEVPLRNSLSRWIRSVLKRFRN